MKTSFESEDNNEGSVALASSDVVKKTALHGLRILCCALSHEHLLQKCYAGICLARMQLK